MSHTYPKNSENPPSRHEVSEIFTQAGREFRNNVVENARFLVGIPVLIAAIPNIVRWQFTVNALAWAPIIAAPVVLPLMVLKPDLADKLVEKIDRGAKALTKPYERPNASWRDYAG